MFGRNSLLSGLALGAGVMYFFDNSHGARRRKLLADRFSHLANQCLHNFDVAWRDLKNRSQGTVAQARGLMSRGDATDELIVQRVRSTIGHCVTHPRLIKVASHNGHVVLRGPVLRSELFCLLRAASMVHGVRTVTDELVVDDSLGNGQAASTPRQTAPSSLDFLNANWSPGTKLLLGGVGTALLGRCLTARRRTLSDVVLGTLGFGMLMRSLAPSSGSSNWQQVQFHKTLLIHAPIEKVFQFITTPGNWATITTRIRNLQWHGEDAFSKDVTVAGIPIHFSERIVCREENECFMTESLPDSSMPYQKQLHFQRAGDHTRLHLTFTYSPPGGAMGHGIGTVFGWDAKSFFDDFLMRAKTYLETGLQPHDAAKNQHAQRMETDAGPASPPHEEAPNQRLDATFTQPTLIGGQVVPLRGPDDL